MSRWAWHMRKRVIYKKKTIFLKLAQESIFLKYRIKKRQKMMMANAIHCSAAEIFSSEGTGVYSRQCTEKKRIAVSKNPAVFHCRKRVFLYKFYNKKGELFHFCIPQALDCWFQCGGGIRRSDRLRDCNLCFFYDFPEAFPVGLAEPSLASVR